MRDRVVLALTGDVMTGRGVDQILPAPGDPRLWEGYVHDARTYVDLAEAVSGPIPRPVEPAYPWGDALSAFRSADLRVINLETSVTAYSEPWPGKAVHYRMHPANTGCLTAVAPDACVLANNHVLDFGVPGLLDTLDSLTTAGLTAVGAGHTAAEAWRPATLAAGGTRVLLWSVGTSSSGVPSAWAAAGGHPGLAFLRGPSHRVAKPLAQRVRRTKRPGDLAVVSIHWGSNWGYEVPDAHVAVAHRLIDAGVDVVHGHSSHHPRPIEVYGGGLVLYGCGDFVNDYEGIHGNEVYRDELRLLYLVTLEPGRGPVALRLVPFRAHRLRLQHAGPDDAAWLAETLTRAGRGFGSRVTVDDDRGTLAAWSTSPDSGTAPSR